MSQWWISSTYYSQHDESEEACCTWSGHKQKYTNSKQEKNKELFVSVMSAREHLPQDTLIQCKPLNINTLF